MSLDIGGAETHIVELARELKRRGVEVCVASNGGVYVPELESAGIRHVKAPLHSKKPSNVLKAYSILKRDIEKNKYDVVHSHARIPAFISGLLSKRMGFRFVSSCHGVYDITALWKMTANWGEHCLAVSCDTKDYLIKNYGIAPENITITINGIDSTRFSRDEKTKSEVCRSIGMNEESNHRIVYVSRIDSASSHVAFMLVSKMEKIVEKYPDAELLIIGGGDVFSDLIKKADELNDKLGRTAVFLTGPRTDLPKLLSAGDVFVGVSRAALEAMATALPVILCGSQGNIGIFTEDSLKMALDTNFCCRGLAMPDADVLYNDIVKLFDMDQSERDEIGRYNRSVVEKHYPLGRMADDALKVYNKMRPKEKFKHGDIVVSGYYGFGNTGDDSLLSVIVRKLREDDPDARITVLSKTPRETERYCTVRSINRFDIFAIRRELKKASLFINGSGNLYQNHTSTRSLWYYTSITRMAKRLGCKIRLYAGGIGPLEGKFAQKTSAKTLDMIDKITLRESMSLDIMKKIGADTSKTSISADPAYLIEKESGEWLSYVMQREKIEGDFFIVALRPWDDVSPDFEPKVAKAISAISAKTGASPVYIAMQKSRDTDVCERIAKMAGGKVASSLSASELVGIFEKARFVIGMRLHTLVYSAIAKTPFIGLAYDTKIRAMVGEFENGETGVSYIDVRSFDGDVLLERTLMINSHRDEISDHVGKKAAALREIADSDKI